MNVRLLLFCTIFVSVSINASPWINTEDIWLRADIETLSEVGIVKVPITTYPLMWSGIVKDLDGTKIENVPNDYKNIFWRVKKAAQTALKANNSSSLSIAAANSPQLIRKFGDGAREEIEIAAVREGMSKLFAWNIEITHVADPADDDNVRFDNSYAAVVIGNWIAGVGYVEKWWGPSWYSNNLLSNNARPPLSLSIQRNYSRQEQNRVLSLLGPWSISGFVSQLEDSREVKDSKLVGLSFSFKPLEQLEVGLRATSLWGGEGRKESISSLYDTLTGQADCDLPANLSCDDLYGEGQYSANGDRIAGFDFKWTLPIKAPISLYYSAYGESESELFPSKTIKQVGVSSKLDLLGQRWKWYFEASDTSLGEPATNIAYSSVAYFPGYRYLGRTMGSSFDSESRSISFGIIGKWNKRHAVNLAISQVDLNYDGTPGRIENSNFSTNEAHSLKILNLNWKYQLNKMGNLSISLGLQDGVENLLIEAEKTSVAAEWTYQID